MPQTLAIPSKFDACSYQIDHPCKFCSFGGLNGKQDSYDVELVEIASHFWDCLNLFELNVICHFI